MTAREFLVDLALLFLIVGVGWGIFSLEEKSHPPSYTEAELMDIMNSSRGAEPETESDYRAGPKAVLWPNLGKIKLFEPLKPTPAPVVETPVPPAAPPGLKEALRNRWAFRYALAGEAMWGDNTIQKDFVLKLDETRDFQFGKYVYTVKLYEVDENSFTARLKVVGVTDEKAQLPPHLIMGPNYTAEYSLLQPNVNP